MNALIKRQNSAVVQWLLRVLVTCTFISVESVAEPASNYIPISTLTTASSSIVASENSQHIFTANFDAGSVTGTDASNPDKKHEQRVGKDVRRLALGLNESQLLVSDTLGGEFIWLDAKTLNVQQRLNTGGRPFGVIYDRQRNLYWATLFETAQLLGLNAQGEIVHKIDTPETPRGLALTPDGRLLITHAMTGQLSIWSLEGCLLYTSPSPRD